MKTFENFNKMKKTKEEFDNYVLKVFPNEEQSELRFAMQKTYDFLSKKEPNKSLSDYMWELYPISRGDEQFYLRNAMIKAQDFLTGKYDSFEKEREKIAVMIAKKMKEQGF